MQLIRDQLHWRYVLDGPLRRPCIPYGLLATVKPPCVISYNAWSANAMNDWCDAVKTHNLRSATPLTAAGPSVDSPADN